MRTRALEPVTAPRPLVAGAVAALLGAAAAEARAEGAPDAVRLAYTAPSACPTAADVEAAIHARTPRFRAAAPGEPARELALTIIPTDDGFEGAVALRDAGRAGERRLRGATCDEVAAAVVLVAAITIDPSVALDAPPPPPPVPPAPPAPPPAPPRPPPWRPPPPPAPPPVAFGFGAHAGAQSGVAPSTSAVGRAFLELAFRPAADGPLRPTVRLAAVRALAQETVTTAGRAELSLSGARVDACPLRLAIAGPVEVRPCAALDVAAHLGAGTRTVGAASETRAWIAPGALARVAVRVVGPLVVEAEGGATFPLFRYRFYFGPDVTAHAAPVASLTGAIGVGLSFP